MCGGLGYHYFQKFKNQKEYTLEQITCFACDGKKEGV